MAKGKRPVPFRTRKLSLSAPMVLPRGRGGRVGHRRTILRQTGVRASLLWPSFSCFPADDRRGPATASRRPKCVRRRRVRYEQTMTSPRRGTGGGAPGGAGGGGPPRGGGGGRPGGGRPR